MNFWKDIDRIVVERIQDNGCLKKGRNNFDDYENFQQDVNLTNELSSSKSSFAILTIIIYLFIYLF